MQVCLYYVALGKSNILGALAKMSRDDQNKVRRHRCSDVLAHGDLTML